MVLFLHNRYRVTGGEEQAVESLLRIAREHLGERVELLERDSSVVGRRTAAMALMAGGLAPGEVAAAVRRSGASIVHAHNLLPGLGWRALAAAQAAGARTILHLHNYRLVCAVGTCIEPRGHDCVRCHGRDTRPGMRLNCRDSRAESLAYGSALALWQRRLVAHADAVVVPSAAAHERLRTLGAPLDDVPVHVLGHAVHGFATASKAIDGTYALVVSRLAREKGVETAIDACAAAGVPLVVCGDGPLASELRRRAAGADVRFAGRVEGAALAELRAGARLAIVPSRAWETFGLAALEAMAAGVPVVATRVGALAELAGDAELVRPGDGEELAAAIGRVWADAQAGPRALAAARRRAAPEVVAPRLAELYGALASR